MKKLHLMLIALLLPIFSFAVTLEEAAGGFTIDVSPLFTMMAVILTGIGSIWAIKKMIALGNKS